VKKEKKRIRHNNRFAKHYFETTISAAGYLLPLQHTRSQSAHNHNRKHSSGYSIVERGDDNEE
jgi:hypothetical protein